MTRNLLPLLGAMILASFGPSMPIASAQTSGPIQSQPQNQSSALVGNWSANMNFGSPGGVMITDSFAANGVVQSTVTTVVRDRVGDPLTMSYMLTGVYQFNAASGTLSYTWKDFTPKQTCVGGNCTPLPAPAPMGVVNTSSIRFLSSTQFVATANGTATTFVRTNAAGFPTQ